MKKVAKSKNIPNVEQEKPSLQPKKMGSEIEEIFAGKKRKKPEQEKKGKDEKRTPVVAARMKPHDGKKGKGTKSQSFRGNSSAVVTSQQRKRTTDGLSVFTEEELGIGKLDAGGTALCPFDCDCCF